jgi:hypothetical protein
VVVPVCPANSLSRHSRQLPPTRALPQISSEGCARLLKGFWTNSDQT